MGCVGDSPAVYFCPRDDCIGELTEFLEGAEESIHCAVYIITLEEVAEVLVERERAGVDVKVVMEKRYSTSKWSQYAFLKEQGVGVRFGEGEGFGEEDGLDGGEWKGIMHNKFCVVDGKRVWTGSMNWSWSGVQKNWENVVVIRDDDVAERYEGEFLRLWLGKV